MMRLRSVPTGRRVPQIDTGPGWMSDVRRGCRPGTDADLFFSTNQKQQNEAIRICNRCDFRRQCHAYATENLEQFGVWGGEVFTIRKTRAANRDRPQAHRDGRPKRMSQREKSAWIDGEVKRRHADGRSDLSIALALGVDPKTVYNSRRRQDLPALYRAGSKRRAEVAA